MNPPVLYSYRRCPYAMRARMALRLAQISVEIREISLREKPRSMLALSPKGTVPVLHLSDGQVIDESLDIMKWALINAEDPGLQLMYYDKFDQALMNQVIAANDGAFKRLLDCYKYPERYPETTREQTLADIEKNHLEPLEDQLSKYAYLLGDQASLVDLAIFPFIRQFSKVDDVWFLGSPYKSIKRWLNYWLESNLFLDVMKKYPTWKESTH